MTITKECGDAHCPKHGGLRTHGRVFSGTVVAAKAQKTITVELLRVRFVPKYERYEKQRTRLKAHVPDCMQVASDQVVRICECRPISKTKNFVVVETVQGGVA